MIDHEELKDALAKMQPRQKIYEIVKTELKKRGNWKYSPRGKNIKETLKERSQDQSSH